MSTTPFGPPPVDPTGSAAGGNGKAGRPSVLQVALFLATAGTAALAGIFWGARSPEDLFTAAGLASGAVYAASLLSILGAHEMGHYLACRHYGIRATLPYFVPGIPPVGTFGAVIRIRSPIPHPTALFDVAAAGPLAGFVVAMPIMIVGLWQATPVPELLPEGSWVLGRPVLRMVLGPLFHPGYDGHLLVGPMYGAGWVGMLVTSLNLFPVGQLDGGHIAYAISGRLHRALSYATLAGLFALIGWQFIEGHRPPAYMLWFVILVWMRDRHPPVMDAERPLPPGRRLIAWLLAMVFLLSFIPLPVSFL